MVGTGYKQTEIGLIPDDWSVFGLDDLSLVIDGDRGSNYPSDTDFLSDGYCLFLSARNVTKQGFRFSECYFITREKDHLLRKGKLERNDIVLTTRGTVGNLAFFDNTVPYDVMRINSGMVIIRNANRTLCHEYLYRVLRSHLTKHQIDKVVFGSAQPQLTVKVINQFQIPLPPTVKEQESIAAVLSDVDALIAGLDKLIAKKRAIKTGTMQVLLSGEKRLPGFGNGQGYKQTEIGRIPEDWEAKTFGDVMIECFSGATPYRGRPEFYKGEIPWITSSELNYNVITDTVEKITEEAARKTNLRVVTKNTFLMAITGLEAAGTRGSCAITGIEATTNQSCMAIIPNSKLLIDFLYHYYIFMGEELAFRYCQGTKQQSYTAGLVKLLPIPIPKIEEQRAIAAIISDMDAEFTALETRRAKTQAIKQGMMRLLTGRTRLNCDLNDVCTMI